MQAPEIDFRPMTGADFGPVVSLIDRLNLSPWSLKDIQAESDRADSYLRVATAVEGSVVGLLIARFVPGRADGSIDAELYNIGVEPGYQGNGIGRRLMEDFIRTCSANQATAIWLEVRRSNVAAIRLYERFGFEAITVRPRFYSDPTEDAVVYHRELGPGSGLH